MASNADIDKTVVRTRENVWNGSMAAREPGYVAVGILLEMLWMLGEIAKRLPEPSTRTG